MEANAVLCCTDCNMAKSDALDQEMISKAFLHLAKLGYNLEWVEMVFGDIPWAEPLPARPKD